MKPFYSLAFCLIGFMLFSMEDINASTRLTGSIINSPTTYITVQFGDNSMNAPTKSQYAFLDEQGDFELEIPISEEQIVTAIVGAETFQYYVVPNQEMNFQWDYSRGITALELQGPNAADNRVLNELDLSFAKSSNRRVLRGNMEFRFDEQLSDWTSSMTVPEYFFKIDELEKEQLNLLKWNSDLCPAFASHLERQIKSNNLIKRLYYFVDNRYSYEVNETEIVQMNSYLTAFGINDPKNVNLQNIDQLVAFYLDYFLVSQGKSSNTALAYYKLTEEHLEGELKFATQAMMFMNSLSSGDRSLAKQKYVQFVDTNPYREHTDVVENEYGSLLRFLPGAKAPDFMVNTEDGQLKFLSDYRGKFVYLKFWASWCAPCLKEFKKEEAFRKKLNQLGVVLLNVSVDKSSRMWRDAMEKMNLQGENVLAGDISFLRDKYNFEILPIGFYIHPDGSFARLSGDKNIALREIETILSSAAIETQ